MWSPFVLYILAILNFSHLNRNWLGEDVGWIRLAQTRYSGRLSWILQWAYFDHERHFLAYRMTVTDRRAPDGEISDLHQGHYYVFLRVEIQQCPDSEDGSSKSSRNISKFPPRQMTSRIRATVLCTYGGVQVKVGRSILLNLFQLQKVTQTRQKKGGGRLIYFPPPMAQQPPPGPGPPRYQGIMNILRHTTVGRTPLDEWSVRRRDLYLTTLNTHNRQTSKPAPRWDSNPQPQPASGRRPTP